MTTGRKTLDPKLDIVFWMLFGEERNRALLISLINAVLQPPVPIEAVEVLSSEPERSTIGDKAIALDVRVRLVGGEQIDIEMQSQRRRALPQRVLYYWARLYAGQLSRGEGYDALRRCAAVLFANFSMLAGPRFHSTFAVRERHDGEVLTDQLEVHVLELPKLAQEAFRNDEPSLALWGKFLAATTDAELETLAMTDPMLKEAKQALEGLSADPRARFRAEQRETALRAYQFEMGAAWHEGKAEGRTEGKAEGRTEGKAEGRTEGKADTLRALARLKFGALPDSAARRIASASEAELDGWLERVLTADSVDALFSP
jgi:predicted transposase/invertase (TIGR01784 family)